MELERSDSDESSLIVFAAGEVVHCERIAGRFAGPTTTGKVN